MASYDIGNPGSKITNKSQYCSHQDATVPEMYDNHYSIPAEKTSRENIPHDTMNVLYEKAERYKLKCRELASENENLEYRLQNVEEEKRQLQRNFDYLQKTLSMQSQSEQYVSDLFNHINYRSRLQDDKRDLRELIQRLNTQVEYSLQRREEELQMTEQLIRKSEKVATTSQSHQHATQNLENHFSGLQIGTSSEKGNNSMMHQRSAQLHQTCDLKIIELQSKVESTEAEKRELEEKQLTLQESARNVVEHSKALQRKLETLSHENNELSSKLSAEMNDKMSSNETDVENVSIKNRPMKVSEEYQQICTTEWLEAKTAIDKAKTRLYSFSEDDAFKFLLQIFFISEKKAFEMVQKNRGEIYKVMLNPLEKKTMIGMPNVDESKIPQKVKSVIGDFMRSSSENMNLQELVKSALNRKKFGKHSNVEYNKEKEVEWEAYKSSSGYKVKNAYTIRDIMDQYIKAVAKLCWNMVNQRPEMTFGTQELQYNPQLHDLQFGSADPSQEQCYFKLYVHPVLFHGDCVMVKGKVLFEKKNNF